MCVLTSKTLNHTQPPEQPRTSLRTNMSNFRRKQNKHHLLAVAAAAVVVAAVRHQLPMFSLFLSSLCCWLASTRKHTLSLILYEYGLLVSSLT